MAAFPKPISCLESKGQQDFGWWLTMPIVTVHCCPAASHKWELKARAGWHVPSSAPWGATMVWALASALCGPSVSHATWWPPVVCTAAPISPLSLLWPTARGPENRQPELFRPEAPEFQGAVLAWRTAPSFLPKAFSMKGISSWLWAAGYPASRTSSHGARSLRNLPLQPSLPNPTQQISVPPGIMPEKEPQECQKDGQL